MTDTAAPKVFSKVIKGGVGARVTNAVMPGVIDTFDPASALLLQNPAGATAANHAAGFDLGYQEGLAQAREDVIAATEDSNKRVRRALAALTQAVDSLDQRQAVALAEVEDAILTAAFEIARKVVQRELVVATDPGADALARSLALVPDSSDVVAHLHPDDAATLNTETLASHNRTVRLAVDSSVELGGCVLEVGNMRIDGQLTTAFDHVKTALGLDPAALPAAPLIDSVIEDARANAAAALADGELHAAE